MMPALLIIFASIMPVCDVLIAVIINAPNFFV